MRIHSPIALLFLVVIAGTGGLGASNEPAAGLEARQSVFDGIQAILDGPDPSERLDAAVALINLTHGYNPLPHPILNRLEELAYDSDPRVARRVSAALARMREHDERASRDGFPSWSEVEAASREAELAEISAGLLSARWTERAGSVVTLSNHVLAAGEASPQATEMLLRAREDSNPRVARLAESVLARIERRPVEPSWRRPQTPKRGAGEDGLEALPVLLRGLENPNPNNRLAALDRLLEAARTFGATEEAEIVTAFEKATHDPHPAVRGAARFALNGGLAGRENALRRVHTGPTPVEAASGPDEQRAVANPTGRIEHSGAYNEAGVFIGIRTGSGSRSTDEPD